MNSLAKQEKADNKTWAELVNPQLMNFACSTRWCCSSGTGPIRSSTGASTAFSYPPSSARTSAKSWATGVACPANASLKLRLRTPWRFLPAPRCPVPGMFSHLSRVTGQWEEVGKGGAPESSSFLLPRGPWLPDLHQLLRL